MTETTGLNLEGTSRHPESPSVAVIGGGPAGLMAAETLAGLGWAVDLYDGMPSVGRKFLLAGVGGMNITHSEEASAFLSRYPQQDFVGPWLREFGNGELRQWVHGLGIETFVGSSGRVFPREMKAAPLLRAWLLRLRQGGVRFHVRHRWLGWDDNGQLVFRVDQHRDQPAAQVCRNASALVLALGGGSWPRLGSDGAWMPVLERAGVTPARLKPANCGFETHWSDLFRERFAGQPLKSVGIRIAGPAGASQLRLGDCMVSRDGLEGGLIYAMSSRLRDRLEAEGEARIEIDLLPGQSCEGLTRDLSKPRGSRSMATHLRQRARLEGVKANLLREIAGPESWKDPAQLARLIKALPLIFTATRPLDEAISSAGGVPTEALDANLMLKALPGVFCTGEMLDWEAETGGYLLTACFASGRAAALGANKWLASQGQTQRPDLR